MGPTPAPGQPRLGEEGEFGWTFEDHGIQVFVPTVELSEKLTWVFGPLIAIPTFWEDPVPREGPLRIGVRVTAGAGATVSFGPGAFAVSFEDGLSLVPLRIATGLEGEGESIPAEPVVLADGESWLGFLEYPVELDGLAPFVLELSGLTVNGANLDLPPIPFERGKTGGSA